MNIFFAIFFNAVLFLLLVSWLLTQLISETFPYNLKAELRLAILSIHYYRY